MTGSSVNHLLVSAIRPEAATTVVRHAADPAGTKFGVELLHGNTLAFLAYTNPLSA